jgi:hypothetical protein
MPGSLTTPGRPNARDDAPRRVQPLRYLHDCSDCFRLERLPGGACTHWKAPPLHGARHERKSNGPIRCPLSVNYFGSAWQKLHPIRLGALRLGNQGLHQRVLIFWRNCHVSFDYRTDRLACHQ